MVVETDYQNAHIVVKRGTEVIHTFKYKEFVPASKIKAINDVKASINKLYKKEATDEIQKELEEAEASYFDILLQTSVENPLPHKEALETFSLPEINSISEEAFVFLVSWSSIEGVKAFGLSQAKVQIEKKDSEK